MPWLLIFDNADSLDALEDYSPTRGTGSVLITSRDSGEKSLWSFEISGLDLEPFSEDEGACEVTDPAVLGREAVDCDEGGCTGGDCGGGTLVTGKVPVLNSD